MTVTARANPDRVKIDWALTVTSIAEKGTTLLNAMEEMRMNPVHPLGEQAKQSRRRRLGYRFHSKRLLKWLGILLFALVLLGVAFQTIATRIDNLSYGPRGQLYTVNGRQMHMVCLGQSRAGEPTVILQAGGANESLWWVRVQSQLADHVRVCAYDRAGLGWSDPADTPRDPATIIGELHDLLAAADIQPPYVMAGHSFGAILTRVYAAHYPNEVAGIALVDGMPLELKGLSAVEFARYRWPSYAVQMPFWVIYHLGVGRLWVARSTEAMGYPPAIARELAAYTLRNQTCATDLAEHGYDATWALMQAALAAEDLGDLPMAVLWASESGTNQPGYAAYRQEVAGYSTNSVTRTIAGADHGSILGNELYAQQVSAAILAVINAAQTGAPLALVQ
ncbi:MAG: alpha/beta hydrolase [Caldilineaceae bacterium]